MISPEGCAAILWKDRALCIQCGGGSRADANELLKLGIVDRVLPEPAGGAHRDWETTAQTIKNTLLNELKDLEKMNPGDFTEHRYRKFRSMGKFSG